MAIDPRDPRDPRDADKTVFVTRKGQFLSASSAEFWPGKHFDYLTTVDVDGPSWVKLGHVFGLQ